MREKEIIQKINDLYILYRKKWLKFDETGYKTITSISISDKAEQVKNHLQGHYTLGVFADEIFTKFICFDVDVKDPQMAKWTVYKLVNTLQELGILGEYIYISTSGNKGYHVEIFFNKPVFNTDIKQFYLMVLNYAELLNIDYGKVELRPTHTQGVKLPLGKHFTTNRICWYVDYEKELKPIEDYNYILTIQQMDSEYFYNILNKTKVPDTKCSKRTFSITTSKKLNIDVSNEHIDAIRNLDVNRIKELICKKIDEKVPSNADISRVRGMGGKSDYNNKDNIYLTYCSHFYPTPFKASNRADLKHIIYTKLCINDFLGVNDGMFKCVLHNDSNPSAHIITLKDGTRLYKCFGCNFTGTIITLVEAIARCNKVEAVEFIQQVYNIEVVETEKQKQIKEMLKENIEYILSEQFEIEYPEIYKVVNRYIPELVCLHEIAIQNVTDDDLIQDNQAIFFTSIRYIANYLKCNNNLKRLSQRINLFTFLGMIEKLSKENIPEKYLQKAEEYKKDKYITSYYSIPSYCFDKMQNINTKAKLYKEKNMTMTGFSRELLIRSLSENEANKVYVQQQNEKLSKASEQFAEKATKIILYLIENQGYCTEEQIIRQIRGKKEEKKVKLKRCLQEIIESYNLTRIKANKELKEKFGIASKGYPFLIIKETEE